MNFVNLDHQAGAALAPEVLSEMQPFLETVHHPGSLHRRGIRAREAMARARVEIAQLLHASSEEEILFTSSSTEAVNLAIKGLCTAHPDKRQVILSAIEPTAVRQCMEWMVNLGYKRVILPVDSSGLISPSDLQSSINEDTALICINWVNNEVGTIQTMTDLAHICAERNVPLFSDAGAAVGWLPINLTTLPISLLSINPASFGAPQGVGALYVRRGIRLIAPDHRDSNDNNSFLRTDYVAGMVGMGTAARLTRETMSQKLATSSAFQSAIWNFVSSNVEDVHLLGPPLGPNRITNHLNLAAQGAEGEALALKLDLQGFAVAARPACLTRSERHSSVLQALGIQADLSLCHILITLGTEYTDEKINRFCLAYQKCVRQLRAC